MIVIVDHLYDAVLTWLDVGDPKRDDEFVSVTSVRVASPHHGLGRAAMTAERIEYDELALFHENADEYGIPWAGPPVVARTAIEVDRASGRAVSALLWGVAPPEIVFVHGGAQNAHTWDTVALALGRSALAVDLPGHGHSGWRDDLAYSPVTNAEDIAIAIEHLASDAAVVVGMSLGGLTSIALAARRPDLVRRLMLVDVTPGVDRGKAKAIIDFVNGPQTFPSFDDIMKRTVEHNPTRTRGVAAARHPPQRAPARRRLVGVELRPPASRRRGGRRGRGRRRRSHRHRPAVGRPVLADDADHVAARLAQPRCRRHRRRRGEAPPADGRGRRRRRRRAQHPGRQAARARRAHRALRLLP